MKVWFKVSLAIAAALCSVPSASATIHTVTIGNNFFAPLGTVVQPGDTVRWVWTGGVPHSTTSEVSSPKAWNSGVTSTVGFTYDVTFTVGDASGAYPYFCTVHAAHMKDTIWVAATGSCCTGPSVGNVDSSPDNAVTMGDLTVLIDHLFISYAALACVEAGNTDMSGDGMVTMGDLTVLIDHLFISYAALSACP